VVGDDVFEPIRTSRLELVPISSAFAEALVDSDRERASSIIGAIVGRSFTSESAHVVQLAITQLGPHMADVAGRVVVLLEPPSRRRAIGSIGFHGPPDDRGRMEVGCRILSAYRGRGYTGEAMAAMFEWAATRLGITRFLVAVFSPDSSAPRLMTELDMSGASGWGDRIAEIEGILDPHF